LSLLSVLNAGIIIFSTGYHPDWQIYELFEDGVDGGFVCGRP
jgi:hypothetical protein